MKELTLVIWITQLGLSIIVPLVGFPIAAAWLCDRFSIGSWLIWVGLALGVYSAFAGGRSSSRAMTRLTKEKRDDPPPVSFNEHD